MRQDDPLSTDNQDTQRLVPIDDAALAAADQASTSAPHLTCPNCGQPCELGDMTCARCGMAFDDVLSSEEDDKTYAVSAEFARRLPQAGSWPRIGTIPDAPVTVILEIDDQPLILPQTETTIVGRGVPGDSDVQGFLDLSQFDARENGVSRNHARILRKDALIYVADIGSANGTWLNGRRLLVNVERLLRNGDELQLGTLKLKVKYT